MKHIIFCSAVMATFIIDNPQCGGNRVDRAQIAAIYLENNHHDQALLEARRALREEGPQAELQLIIALAHMGLEEDSAALEVLVNAIEIDPANDKLHGALRSLCEKEAIRAEARSALIKLQDEMPPHAAMLATAAWIELQLAQEARSMALLDSAIALDPNYLYARVERSRMARKNADWMRAESELREALRIAPNQPRLLIALGEILLKQTHTASADSAFAQALLHGDSINIAAHIAHIYSEQNHAERAIEYYELAIERAPENARLLNNLAWSYAETGIELERATRLSLRSLQLDGENPVYMDTYAELLYLQKRYAHAFAVIRRALDIESQEQSEYSDYLRSQYQKMERALGPRASM
jgi:Tfp pilus assembly protein PilF